MPSLMDIILILFLALILGLAIAYIVKEKKRGVKCIGCPNSGCCSKKCSGSSDCGCGK